MIGTACQPEAIHRHSSDGIIGDLELHAVVDGACLVIRYGKDGAGDQLLEFVLRNADGVAAADIRQVGVFVGGFCADGKGGVAGADGHMVLLVHHNGDGPFGQTANDVTEQLGEDALALVGHVGGNLIGNGSFHIIAGEGDAAASLTEDALDGGQSAFLRHGAPGNVQPLQEQAFFTGKSHIAVPFYVKE